MVSFSCEGCGDVLTKKKLDAHRNQCRGASFTCLDCMVHFQGMDYRSHTSCVSEAQKYQGALYRPEKEKKAKQVDSKALIPRSAYVEDEPEDAGHNSHIVIVDPPMPEAPEPPSAAPDFVYQSNHVNVFDFLVNGETPNPSHLELPAAEDMKMLEGVAEESRERDIVRVRFEDEVQNGFEGVEYGSGPIPGGYQTPAPKTEREIRKARKDREERKEVKQDKKRKRLHVETQDLKGDEEMTDAPPVLHSGLTGGLNRLLRPSVFPPSPDYSGGDVADASPGSPLKKTKHSKRGGRESIGNNLMSLISTRRSVSREHSEDTRPKKKKDRRHRERPARVSQKMIEYSAMSGEDSPELRNQMVVYKPRAELLLGFINKGPESEKGVSMNKALKRYHRERHATGSGQAKAVEEKELWRSLRMKRNDRGEIVLFMG